MADFGLSAIGAGAAIGAAAYTTSAAFVARHESNHSVQVTETRRHIADFEASYEKGEVNEDDWRTYLGIRAEARNKESEYEESIEAYKETSLYLFLSKWKKRRQVREKKKALRKANKSLRNHYYESTSESSETSSITAASGSPTRSSRKAHSDEDDERIQSWVGDVLSNSDDGAQLPDGLSSSIVDHDQTTMTRSGVPVTAFHGGTNSNIMASSGAMVLSDSTVPPIPQRQQEDISTIFVVGFPDDFHEREFRNLFALSPGFEAATLKIPNKAHTSSPSMLPRGQVIGFAKFRTPEEAIHARNHLQGWCVDIENGAVLRAEMAKRNLHKKPVVGDWVSRGPANFGSSCSHVTTSLHGINGTGVKPHQVWDMSEPGNHPCEDENHMDAERLLSSGLAREREEDDQEQRHTNGNMVHNTVACHAFYPLPQTMHRQTFNNTMHPCNNEQKIHIPILGRNPHDISSFENLSQPFMDAAGPWDVSAQWHTGTRSGIPTEFEKPTALRSFWHPNPAAVASEARTFQPLSPSRRSFDSMGSNLHPSSVNGDFQHGLNSNTVTSDGRDHIYPSLPNPSLPNPGSGDSSGGHTVTCKSVDQNPPINTLYIGNLPGSPLPGHLPDSLEDNLRALFQLQKGYRRLSFRQKSSGPMCFVEFEDTLFATKTLNELIGHTLNGLVKGGIRLSYSKNPLGVRTPTNYRDL